MLLTCIDGMNILCVQSDGELPQDDAGCSSQIHVHELPEPETLPRQGKVMQFALLAQHYPVSLRWKHIDRE